VLNSEFMVNNAKALAAQLAAAGENDEARLRAAFVRLYGREPNPREVQLGLAYLNGGPVAGSDRSEGPGEKLSRWEQYAQVLLGANEFMYID
jgi:hypothetical protein